MNIAIDFDNCITTYAVYPAIGDIRPEAIEVMNILHKEGHVLIINSCRTGYEQKRAIKVLENNDVPFDYFNENNPELIEKYGEDSRKISADIYYDDRMAGGMISWQDFLRAVRYESKPKIICIVGESGSGKSMLADYLESQYKIPMIHSYTTRPKRTPDETGHVFIGDTEFDEFNREDMIAFTKFGEYRYCCLKKDVSDVCTYVIDEHGLRYLRKNFLDIYNIISIRRSRDYSYRAEEVGLERVRRDEGMFSLMDEDFDFISKSKKYIAKVHKDADEIIDRILVRKINQWGESLIF